MADSEKITVSKKHRPTDFVPMLEDMVKEIPCKMMFIMFLVFMLLSSDVFINRILARVDGAVSYIDTPTTYGTCLMALMFIVLFAVFDVLVKKQVV